MQLSHAVVRPSAASWAASTTTVTGLGWRVRPGWGLCIPNLVSLRPQPGLGGHGPLPHVEGDQGSELGVTSLLPTHPLRGIQIASQTTAPGEDRAGQGHPQGLAHSQCGWQEGVPPTPRSGTQLCRDFSGCRERT